MNAMDKALAALPSPAYVADIAAIEANLAKAAWLKEQTGCQILLATKSFSIFPLFGMFAKVLDGTTASGLYEARLGHEHFKGEVHTYSPAYTDAEMEALLPISSHIYFNSVAQLERFAPLCTGKHLGLRLNPQFSLVKNNALYDPSAKGSRFGAQTSDLTKEGLEKIDVLHIHNLCENLAEDSVALIEHVMKTFPEALKAVSTINLGGGHYITHPDYDLPKLADAINRLKAAFGVQVVLEPGGALVFDAGYLVATVVDVVKNENTIAILDTSATCHMPDVLEVPYTPRARILGEEATVVGAHDVTLAGKTCLTGDTIGHYHFPRVPVAGDKIIFMDMMQYTMVKNTTFNGLPLPAICTLEADGSTRILKEFSYEDFKERLG